ncbi:MAG: TetR/AcrR family transcriptional regulator [Croceibacterium sp.]
MKAAKTHGTAKRTATRKAAARGYHHGDLRSALVAAAAALLERHGAEALSFRAVARAAGVSQAAPYNHFSGRDELLATVAEAGFRALHASQVAAAEQAPPGLARVIGLGMDYLGFATARPQLYRLMFGVGVANWCAYPAVDEAKHETFGPFRAALLDYLGAETPPATLAAAAHAGWALVHGLSMLRLDGSAAARGQPGDLQREHAALELFATSLAGIGTMRRTGGNH